MFLKSYARKSALFLSWKEKIKQNMHFYQFIYSKKLIEMPKTENFYIYAVLDGSIRLHTPSGIMDYLPGQYSISKIDIPASGHVLTFSEKDDFLALSIEITLNDVISVLLDLDGNIAEKIANDQLDAKMMSSSDNKVFLSILRLFSMNKDPMPLGLWETTSNVKLYFLFCAVPVVVSFYKVL